jgi:glycosyltransferase involved in cell wall biosynthesis
MRLSVIVPVYNVEPYLRKCIDSLLNQDLPGNEYEIVLVDDGSTDQCGTICDEYASHHSHVVALHQANGGLSAARNSGIDEARGDYVFFVDSDDFVEPNVLKTLTDKVETEDLDVLRFNYRNVNERYEAFEPNKVSKPFMDYRDEVCDGPTFLVGRLGYGCYAWQFLIRRALLDVCRFKKGIYLEDTEWTPRLLAEAQRVTSTDLIVYNYLQRNGSITQNKDVEKKKKLLADLFSLIDSMQEQKKEIKDTRWHEGIIAQTALYIIGFVSENYYQQRAEYLKQLKAKQIFPLSSYHALPAVKRKVFLANLSPRLLCSLLHFKNG